MIETTSAPSSNRFEAKVWRRLWQLALLVGLFLWLALMVRAIRPALKEENDQRPLLALFLISAIAIAVFYMAALGYGRRTNLAMAEYWRWWVVHLWVEGFFEVFATVVIAFLFARLKLVVHGLQRFVHRGKRFAIRTKPFVALPELRDELGVRPFQLDQFGSQPSYSTSRPGRQTTRNSLTPMRLLHLDATDPLGTIILRRHLRAVLIPPEARTPRMGF